MQYHEDAIQWLKENIRGQGGWVYIYEYSRPLETMMITTLLHDNIIKFDGIHKEPQTGALLRYVLTPIGDVIMGIPATDASPDTDAPQATDADNGVQWHGGSEWTHRLNIVENDVHQYPVYSVGNAINLTSVLNNYRNELNATRQQLSSAQERVQTLEGELQAAQKISERLAKQIDDAGYYLGQASDKDENSNRAYNILKGYSQAE